MPIYLRYLAVLMILMAASSLRAQSADSSATTRPATCEASFTSSFGGAATAPRTSSGSTRSRFVTTAVSAAIVGTAAE